MSSCDVSVVIPAYNAEHFIVDALDSISRQTRLPFEVIVINDGSSDRTRQVIQDWIEKAAIDYPVYLHTQENRGLPATRNVGIGHAKGKWIALLDADDIWEPCHLAELMAATDIVPSAIAAYGAGRLLVGEATDDKLYDDFWDNPSQKFGQQIGSTSRFVIDFGVFPRLIKGNFIKPSSLMFSRESANEIGLFNETLRTAEDREFLVRLLRKGDFIYSRVAITQYRWHDDNISQTKNSKRNMENALRALRVIGENDQLALNRDEIAALRSEVRLATKGYLYVCSLEGIKTYVNGVGFVKKSFGLGNAWLAMNPKDMIRCLASWAYPNAGPPAGHR